MPHGTEWEHSSEQEGDHVITWQQDFKSEPTTYSHEALVRNLLKDKEASNGHSIDQSHRIMQPEQS